MAKKTAVTVNFMVRMGCRRPKALTEVFSEINTNFSFFNGQQAAVEQCRTTFRNIKK